MYITRSILYFTTRCRYCPITWHVIGLLRVARTTNEWLTITTRCNKIPTRCSLREYVHNGLPYLRAYMLRLARLYETSTRGGATFGKKWCGKFWRPHRATWHCIQPDSAKMNISARRLDVDEMLFRWIAIVLRSLWMLVVIKQEAQLMLTTGSTRLAVSRGQQTWYHSTCYI